jgi:hypothetical protein
MMHRLDKLIYLIYNINYYIFVQLKAPMISLTSKFTIKKNPSMNKRNLIKYNLLKTFLNWILSSDNSFMYP